MEELEDTSMNEDDVEVVELDDNAEHFHDFDDEDEGGAGEQLDEDVENMDAVVDDADVIFSSHTGSVFCCDLEPTLGQLAVSGGEDDRAFVWNTTTSEVVFECTGHKDSVTCAAFNYDGTLVATGDMSGVVQVWQVASKSKLWSSETSDLAWLQWHPKSQVIFAGTIDGDLWMWRIPSGDCKTFAGHGTATDCCKILADGKRAAVGYGDGTIKIWDLKSATALHNITGSEAHKGDITCIDSYSDNVLLLSGAIDGTAKLINSVSGKVLATLDCNSTSTDEKDMQNSLETVGFCSNLPLCATGNLKGQLCIWDVATQVQRQVCKHEAGIVRLVWDHASPLVYTVGMDGAVRLWDARNGKLASQWTGHMGEILDVVLSRDGSTILTASDDKTCRLFHVNKPDR